MLAWGEGASLKKEGVSSFLAEGVMGVVPKGGSDGGGWGVSRLAFNARGCVVDLVGCRVIINWGGMLGEISNWGCGVGVMHVRWSWGPSRLGHRERVGPQALVVDKGGLGAAVQGGSMEGGLGCEQQICTTAEGETDQEGCLSVVAGI